MGDDDAHLGVGGDGLAQVFDRAFAKFCIAVPDSGHFIGERVVAGIDLPADGAGDEIDHGGGGGGR